SRVNPRLGSARKRARPSRVITPVYRHCRVAALSRGSIGSCHGWGIGAGVGMIGTVNRHSLAMLSDRVYVRSMPPVLMTAEELLHTSIADKRVELVRGVLVAREPAGYRHGRVSMNLAFLLSKHVEGTEAGQVISGDTGFKLASDPDTVRAPDVAFIGRERLPDPQTRGFPALGPDLVVEVLSPDDRPAEISPRSSTGWKEGLRSSGSSTTNPATFVCILR